MKLLVASGKKYFLNVDETKDCLIKTDFYRLPPFFSRESSLVTSGMTFAKINS